jgi:hypothetical protein
MPRSVALAALVLAAATSCALASTPPSNPLEADLLTIVLPGAHADDRAAVLARNGWQPAQVEGDVEVTGGPASQPKTPQLKP